jgi:hypothetical protein
MRRTRLTILDIRSRAALLADCSFVHEEMASKFEAHNLARHALCFDVGRHVLLMLIISL